MTSSWNSVARWVSSMATAAWMTRGSFGSPNCAPKSTSRARNRLPPAAMECLAASVNSSSPGCAVAMSDASTRARSSRTSAARAESGKSTGTAVITHSPGHRYARTPRIPEYARSAPPKPRPSAHEQRIRGVAGQAQERFGHDAEHHRRRDAEAHGGAGEHARHHHLGPVGYRVAEEHQHDDPDVEEPGDRAGQHADDDQRRLPGGDRGLEDGELPGEPAGQRDAREGQQEQREDAR